MAGSSIAGRDAAPWVTDFLNAAYYRRDPAERVGGFDESIARISIGSLVYSIARRKETAVSSSARQRCTTPGAKRNARGCRGCMFFGLVGRDLVWVG